MGNTNSNENDTVNLKMSKEQYQKYQQYMKQQQISKKQQYLKQQQILKQQQYLKQQQMSKQQLNANNYRREYKIQNEYNRYNQDKKNVDNRVNNYQMFNTRQHQRDFRIRPIGVNTSSTDISSNFSPNLTNSKEAYRNIPINTFSKPPLYKSAVNRNNNFNNQSHNNNFNKQSYNKVSRTNSGDISIEKCDPFNILKQNKKISLENLRDKYKKSEIIK